MALDGYANLAVVVVAQPPVPATTGTTLAITAGMSVHLPPVPFNATVWPAGVIADWSNAEIVRVTAIVANTLTIVRNAEPGPTVPRAILAGDFLAATFTAKWVTDLSSASNLTGTIPDARLSSNVALKNTANTFTQNQTLQGLSVNGNTSLFGTLGVVGAMSANAGLTAANIAVGGASNLNGLVTCSGGLAVSGGSLVVAGSVTLGTVGVPSGCTGSGTGIMEWRVVNTAAGATNSSLLSVGNDTNQQLGMLQSFASNFTQAAYQKPNSTALIGNGGQGLSLVTTGVTSLELWTNSLRRVVVDSGGNVLIGGLGSPVFSSLTAIATDGTLLNPLVIQNTNPTNTINFVAFLNSAAAVAGTITQTGAATVAYNTSSDQRLKTDRGIATDLAALRAVVVHDFTWTADGSPDRGVFAQEAHPLYPRAVTEGTDERTASGDLQQPWMTDYSKFVPDLIVGWHAHDAAITELRATLARVLPT